MAWLIDITAPARKNLLALDRSVSRRIMAFIEQRLALLDDPRSIGEAWHGETLGDLWKYRVGDYRLIARIQDRVVTITVVRIAHRREAYRR